MIRIRGLTKRYNGNVVVDALDLETNRGELLVLLGPSGCGKTTTLKMINRLVEPSAGQVWINGKNAASLSPPALRRSIGYVFQEVGLFPHMTVARNAGILGEILKWDRPRVARRVDQLLEMVDLDPTEFRDRYPHELSGGQRQRVGVARALFAEPDVLLMDEPFGALDPITRDKLQCEFVDLHRRIGATVIFVTHDMTEALLIGDRIAVMNRGRIVRLDTPDRLLRDPGDEFVAQLMATPKRQADRLEELAGAGPARQAAAHREPAP